MPDLKMYVNADPNAPQGKPKYTAPRRSRTCRRNWQKQRPPWKRLTGAQPNQSRPTSSSTRQAAVRLRLAEVCEAVPCPLDLERRPVHLHPGRRDRAARALRGQGRQAGLAELPGARRTYVVPKVLERAIWHSARSASTSCSRGGEVWPRLLLPRASNVTRRRQQSRTIALFREAFYPAVFRPGSWRGSPLACWRSC